MTPEAELPDATADEEPPELEGSGFRVQGSDPAPRAFAAGPPALNLDPPRVPLDVKTLNREPRTPP
ncbi:MAG TPA: hypothetical protein VGM03_05275, partial [Phycisphaerae bacterium]